MTFTKTFQLHSDPSRLVTVFDLAHKITREYPNVALTTRMDGYVCVSGEVTLDEATDMERLLDKVFS